MSARQLGVFLAARREACTYIGVICCLLAISAWEHATHWSLSSHAAAATHSGVSNPKLESATPAAVEAHAGNTAEPTVVDLPQVDAVELGEDSAKKAGIQVETAIAQPLEQAIVAHGIAEYNQDALAQLSTRVQGNVWRVERRVGQPVKRGDVLAIVESLKVGDAKTELLQAIVSAELKRRNLERLQELKDAVAGRAIREADAADREAQVRLLSARQTLVSLGLNVNLDELRGMGDEQLARKLQFLGLPADLARSLDPATTTGNLIPMAAPFDGLVIGRAITVGEIVSPDHPQFTIADTSRMWLMLEVRKEDAGLVRVGQRMKFSADAFPGAVDGTIDWISTELDEKTRTLTVRAVVMNPMIEGADERGDHRLLRANMFGTGRIVVRERPGAVMVSNAAVQFDGARHFVFVRDGVTFRRRWVMPGVVSDGQTEIVDGLMSGELVATEGSHVLKAELMILAAQ